MCLRELSLKKAYDSDADNILEDFYIPVLSCSVRYRRLAGFFTSSSLSIAAKGILSLIANKGKFELVCGARLTKRDVDAIVDGYKNPSQVISEFLINDLENLEDQFATDHVRALAWMVASKKLDIKMAILVDENGRPLEEGNARKHGMFHQKVGILEDSNGDRISFSGSENESASAWSSHIEEFKVFRSWRESENEYLISDLQKFSRFWNGLSKRVQVIDIPEAAKSRLIEMAPEDIGHLNLERWYPKRVSRKPIALWEHQNAAVEKWLNNDGIGIFEMATGTGKTFAALECVRRVMDRENRLVTVIACPQTHHIRQWLGDLTEFGISCETVVADSSTPNWKDKLVDGLLDIRNGIVDKLVVFTTHASFPSDFFVQEIRSSKAELFLVADEVHGIGAPKRKTGLLDEYHYRLGLSATPTRWFDLEGTENLLEYFGGTVFELDLKKAITTRNPSTGKTYLAPYVYKPFFVELTDEELEGYQKESEKIARSYHRTKDEKERQEWFHLLCIKRQRIVKNALNKYRALYEILDSAGDLDRCLVYCMPEQIDRVQEILNDRNIIQHKFTMTEGTTPQQRFGGLSEREFLLKEFAAGKYQALVAMTCLDEGVDIPSARSAIIMASTGNPREYIQRRGRVLRQSPRKDRAVIYDVIVIPSLTRETSDDMIRLERKILTKELKRYKEFAEAATNTVECLMKIEKIQEKFRISLGG